MKEKEWLSALKPMVNAPMQWKAFCEMIDYYCDLNTRKLEQASDVVEIHRSQGAIMALRKLKTLRDEINGSSK